jgi:hypothetical protein
MNNVIYFVSFLFVQLPSGKHGRSLGMTLHRVAEDDDCGVLNNHVLCLPKRAIYCNLRQLQLFPQPCP